jgi:hypothetical protein
VEASAEVEAESKIRMVVSAVKLLARYGKHKFAKLDVQAGSPALNKQIV